MIVEKRSLKKSRYILLLHSDKKQPKCTLITDDSIPNVELLNGAIGKDYVSVSGNN